MYTVCISIYFVIVGLLIYSIGSCFRFINLWLFVFLGQTSYCSPWHQNKKYLGKIKWNVRDSRFWLGSDSHANDWRNECCQQSSCRDQTLHEPWSPGSNVITFFILPYLIKAPPFIPFFFTGSTWVFLKHSDGLIFTPLASFCGRCAVALYPQDSSKSIDRLSLTWCHLIQVSKICAK